jgi:hypothetical protein
MHLYFEVSSGQNQSLLLINYSLYSYLNYPARKTNVRLFSLCDISLHSFHIS